MSEKEPPSAYTQLQIRFREHLGRAGILRKLKLDKIVADKERFEEDPTNENCKALLIAVFEHGLELGQLKCDNHWVDSLMKMGLPSGILMKAWDLKDEEQRNEKEKVGGLEL